MAEGGRGKLVTAMQDKLKELSAAHDLVIKNNAQLVKQIAEIEGGMVGGASIAKLKEKLALFKLTSDAMAKVGNSITHTHMHTRMHAHTHAYTYTHTHIHTHTHTHTSVFPVNPFSVLVHVNVL